MIAAQKRLSWTTSFVDLLGLILAFFVLLMSTRELPTDAAEPLIFLFGPFIAATASFDQDLPIELNEIDAKTKDNQGYSNLRIRLELLLDNSGDGVSISDDDSWSVVKVDYSKKSDLEIHLLKNNLTKIFEQHAQRMILICREVKLCMRYAPEFSNNDNKEYIIVLDEALSFSQMNWMFK